MSPGCYLTPGKMKARHRAFILCYVWMREDGTGRRIYLSKGLPCEWDVMLPRQVSRGRLRHRARRAARQIWCLWFNFTPINWSQRCYMLFYVYFVLHNVCQFEQIRFLKMLQSSIVAMQKKVIFLDSSKMPYMILKSNYTLPRESNICLVWFMGCRIMNVVLFQWVFDDQIMWQSVWH